jgi:hypothetical protein
MLSRWEDARSLGAEYEQRYVSWIAGSFLWVDLQVMASRMGTSREELVEWLTETGHSICATLHQYSAILKDCPFRAG